MNSLLIVNNNDNNNCMVSVQGQIDVKMVITSPDQYPKEKHVLSSESGQYFELGRLIRRAIYGQVNHAFILKLNENKELVRIRPYKNCAVKIFEKKRFSSRCQENPLSEIGLMQLMGFHENVMTAIECCEDEKFIYLVMEYCDGGDLLDHVQRHPRFHETVLCTYMHQILSAVRHLHSQGIVHRDLSLENILVSNGGRTCKIIDFGMALCVPQNPDTNQYLPMNYTGIACGKKAYIAPEVLASIHKTNPMVDAMAADIWSTAVIFFSLASHGGQPFETASPCFPNYNAVVKGQLSRLFQAMRMSLSEEALHLMQWMFQEDPRLRPTVDQALAHPWFECMNSVHVLQ